MNECVDRWVKPSTWITPGRKRDSFPLPAWGPWATHTVSTATDRIMQLLNWINKQIIYFPGKRLQWKTCKTTDWELINLKSPSVNKDQAENLKIEFYKRYMRLTIHMYKHNLLQYLLRQMTIIKCAVCDPHEDTHCLDSK